MKQTLIILSLGLAILSLTAMSFYSARSYTIVEGYAIRFDGRGAEGTFTGLKGQVRFDPDDLQGSYLNVTVDATTIATGNLTKDRHARGEDWFDTDHYPTIAFEAHSFQAAGEGGFLADGTLTLHGVSKSLSLPFTFTKTKSGGVFAGTTEVNRQDYGIEGPWLGFTVSNQIAIELTVPVN